MRPVLNLVIGCAVILTGCATGGETRDLPDAAERKAIEFLQCEVPAWASENNCFSCHNNGDAARALYAASSRGYKIPSSALADTTTWVMHPKRWEHNKGDPGFSDKRLATLQFAASLLAAIEAGHVKDRAPLREAARKVAADQGTNGAWEIDAQSAVGSPATYGTALATYTAWRILISMGEPKPAIRRAELWLQNAKPKDMLEAAVLLRASTDSSAFARHQTNCLNILRSAQTSDGGWGPYADAPPEVFDTALVLLALADLRGMEGVERMIARGRQFLIAEQRSEGSWPATTRPRGGESYAQQMSTTGWATLALLRTK